MEALSRGLQGNGNLTRLNLDHTILGDDGLEALADMLLHNASLRRLSLRYNRFTSKVPLTATHHTMQQPSRPRPDVTCPRPLS